MNESPVPGHATGGVMVVRVWNEAGRPDGFRARVTFGDGEGDADSASAVFADRDEVVEAIRAWLDRVTPPPVSPADGTSH